MLFKTRNSPLFFLPLLAFALLLRAGESRADAITDWNARSAQFIIDAKLGTPPAIRIMAIVQTAANDAAQRASKHGANSNVAVDAAIAAAHRITLTKLVPSQQAAIEAAAQSALAALPEGTAKSAGIEIGENAAAAVLAARSDDGAGKPEAYRPHASAGAYVPTVVPAVPQWRERKSWHMSSPAQFRPGPPPALDSERWARDYNEVKDLGGRTSTARIAEQTDIARFWEFSLPSIYHGVARSVAEMPGRDTLRNARLFAAMAQAMDDAMIAVFDAKYHYNFWRPVTAIRNADLDSHASTAREQSWAPLIENPMHPEYPSGHSILAGAVASVVTADMGNAKLPTLATSSPSAKGATRQWTSLDAFTQEIGNARIYGGLHYRFSIDAAQDMGKRIGELAASRVLRDAR